MSEDHDYIVNYAPDRLYVHPSAKGGAYATIVAEQGGGDGQETEEVLGEVDVSPKTRLAISMFHITNRNDWNRLKITKLQQTAKGWDVVGEVALNQFDGEKLGAFLEILSSLDLAQPTKARISLGEIRIGQLSTLLKTDKGKKLVERLSQSPDLEHDIIAVAARRRALTQFEEMLAGEGVTEAEWQAFFQANPWVFGYGLTFIFLTPTGEKLETVTTGATFDRSGKRTDALMRTRAAVSQSVLVEIKRCDTRLLQAQPYRSGCWSMSAELSGAVTQLQKTAFDFARDRFRTPLKDDEGTDIGQDVFAVEPRTYLVVGNQSELRGNEDKITCFELYRRNVRSPEVLTFDELFERARCIVAEAEDRSVEG